ncbi:hypothetical protein ACFV1T_21475, partial [Streptomyces vinaceus]
VTDHRGDLVAAVEGVGPVAGCDRAGGARHGGLGQWGAPGVGGGAVGAVHAVAGGEGAASASHPGAFVVVFLPMACVALVGAWVATRLHGERPEPAAAHAPA